MSTPLLIIDARVLTLGGPGPARGPEAMNDLGILPRADVLITGDRITAVEPAPSSLRRTHADWLEAAGRVLMPGFVDCHTHACWAGDRLDEWELKRKGVPYLDILKSGGGIMSTVRATRAASEAHLAFLTRARLSDMLRHGTTTAEVKTGYGLLPEHELKMLRAILAAARDFPGTVWPTALLGHAIDPDFDRPTDAPPTTRLPPTSPQGGTPRTRDLFIEDVLARALPAMKQLVPRITVDAFCESGAWTLEECLRLFERAAALGLPWRVHADQFTSLGMIPEAIRRGARSVDHLEATTHDDLLALARSSTFGVILPCCGFHVDGRYASGRAFVDAGGALAVATNYNPGSAPCPAMPMAIALAVRHCGLTPAEAITAATRNPAALLGLPDRGHLTPRARADLILLRHTDERSLAYEFGGNPVDAVICGGRVVCGQPRPGA